MAFTQWRRGLLTSMHPVMNNGSRPQSSATGIEKISPTVVSESANFTIEMGAPGFSYSTKSLILYTYWSRQCQILLVTSLQDYCHLPRPSTHWYDHVCWPQHAPSSRNSWTSYYKHRKHAQLDTAGKLLSSRFVPEPVKSTVKSTVRFLSSRHIVYVIIVLLRILWDLCRVVDRSTSIELELEQWAQATSQPFKPMWVTIVFHHFLNWGRKLGICLEFNSDLDKL